VADGTHFDTPRLGWREPAGKWPLMAVAGMPISGKIPPS
jgi:hypothetical protein